MTILTRVSYVLCCLGYNLLKQNAPCPKLMEESFSLVAGISVYTELPPMLGGVAERQTFMVATNSKCKKNKEGGAQRRFFLSFM